MEAEKIQEMILIMTEIFAKTSNQEKNDKMVILRFVSHCTNFFCFSTWIDFRRLYWPLKIDKISWEVKFYNYWVCFDQFSHCP